MPVCLRNPPDARTVCYLPCRSATSKIMLIVRPKRQRAPHPLPSRICQYLRQLRTRTDKSHADTPMNPIRSRADMPANQPYDKTPCRSAYGTDPALAPYCHIPSTTDSAAMPAITILIAPIRLRSTDRIIVPVHLRLTDRLIDKLSA